MLYNNQKKLCRHLLVGGVLCAAGLGMFSCTDDMYDLDTKQPSGLNSIYGYLQGEGNYKNYTQLIRDLGQVEILDKTGSNTLFVADDDAFAEFYKSNKWGVTRYEDLTKTQKALLLKSSMIGNPLTTTLLSTAQGSVRGEVCRRNTSQTILDSVLVVSKTSDVLPNTMYFDKIRGGSRDSIVLFTDNSSAAPMVHFTAKFIGANKIQYSDIDFVLNDKEGTLAKNESEFLVVNGARVKDVDHDANIFCKNGFVHKVDRVIMPLDNMAEIIRKDPETKVWSSILERYAAVEVDPALTRSYYGDNYTDGDSVFIKRYFSKWSYGSDPKKTGTEAAKSFSTDAFGNKADDLLKFDPGWNALVSQSFNDRVPLMEDLAVMMVPTDAAFNDWWNNGSGADLKNAFGTPENTPLKTLSELVNVNMYDSFTKTIPSRASAIFDDDGSPIGINFATDVARTEIGSNGIVYYTNKVFTPKSYASVLFPSVVEPELFRTVSAGLDSLDYKAYLNSMVSKYTFFLPTNDAMLTYIDPVSYALPSGPNMWQFVFDEKGKDIYAKVYKCTRGEDGSWIKGDSITSVGLVKNVAVGCKGQNTKSGDEVLADRMEDILDNIIVIESLVPGKKFYYTKGRNYVRVEGDIAGAALQSDKISVAGSGQVTWNQPIQPIQVFNKENGQTFVTDALLMSTDKSVAAVLKDHEEFSEFFEIVNAAGAFTKSNPNDKWQAADQVYGNLFNIKNYGQPGAEDAPAGKDENNSKATYLLNNFHYTIYAPTNDAMEKAFAMGLPHVSDIDALESEIEALQDSEGENDEGTKAKIKELQKQVSSIKEAMLDFVKYHIQDNSVYMDKGFESKQYETAKTELTDATAVVESGNYAPEKITYDSNNKPLTITVGIQTYNIKSIDPTGNVIYYTGKYTAGRPYKLGVDVDENHITVSFETKQLDGTKKAGVSHVVPELANLMAREYWVTGEATITDAFKRQINNSSSVAVHGIDTPLVYDMDQFVYKYKPIDQSNSVKPRK